MEDVVLEKENKIGKVIKYFGWLIIIVGISVGIYLFFHSVESATNTRPPIVTIYFPLRSIAYYVWGSSFVSGIMMLGLSEIIILLDKIHKKLPTNKEL